MYLRSIYLHQFRCYREALFNFLPGINAIVGTNARGKTTLLEAIYLLISGQSFRSQLVGDLIQWGSPSFYIEAHFVKHQIEQTLKIFFDGKQKKIFHNNTLCSSTAHLYGILHGVVVTPDDASLIKGPPQLRRHYLDLQISQIDPLYVYHLNRYHRAMRQRNVLLKAKKAATLTVWEHEMSQSAAYLSQQRLIAIQDLDMLSRQKYRDLTNEENSLTLMYKGSFSENQDCRHFYLEQYEKNRKREMELGYTLIGPHKDDVQIAIGEKEARFFASEGQQRSCVAALRFAEWERLKQFGDSVPLMLMDDVGISLDHGRKTRLHNHLQTFGQVFLTSTEPFPGHIIEV